jgi:hypothetical protein
LPAGALGLPPHVVPPEFTAQLAHRTVWMEDHRRLDISSAAPLTSRWNIRASPSSALTVSLVKLLP